MLHPTCLSQSNQSSINQSINQFYFTIYADITRCSMTFIFTLLNYILHISPRSPHKPKVVTAQYRKICMRLKVYLYIAILCPCNICYLWCFRYSRPPSGCSIGSAAVPPPHSPTTRSHSAAPAGSRDDHT